MAGEPSSIPANAQVLVNQKDGVEDKTYVYDDGKNIVVERNLDFDGGGEPQPLGKREGVTLQAGRRNIQGHEYHTVRRVFYDKAKGFDVPKVLAELPKLLEYEGKCPHCSKAAQAAKPLRVTGAGTTQPAKTGGSSRTPRQPKPPKPADWSKPPAPAFKPRPPPRPKSSAPPAPSSPRAPAPSGPAAPSDLVAPGTGPFHIAEEGATVPRSGFLGFGVVGSLGVLPSSSGRSGRVAEPGRMRSNVPHVPRPGLLKDISGDAREAIEKLKQSRPRLSEVFSF